MSSGRIQALLISTRGGHVLYERFYDAFTEIEKAEIRSAFDDTADDEDLIDGQEQVGRYKQVRSHSSLAAFSLKSALTEDILCCRNGRIVAIPSGELIFFGVGTGEYNELAVAEVLRTLIDIYKEVFKVPSLTDAILLQNYPTTILVIDEVLKQGLPEHMDKPSILKTLTFKLPVFTGDPGDKGRSLMSRFSSKDIKLSS